MGIHDFFQMPDAFTLNCRDSCSELSIERRVALPFIAILQILGCEDRLLLGKAHPVHSPGDAVNTRALDALRKALAARGFNGLASPHGTMIFDCLSPPQPSTRPVPSLGGAVPSSSVGCTRLS